MQATRKQQAISHTSAKLFPLILLEEMVVTSAVAVKWIRIYQDLLVKSTTSLPSMRRPSVYLKNKEVGWKAKDDER